MTTTAIDGGEVAPETWEQLFQFIYKMQLAHAVDVHPKFILFSVINHEGEPFVSMVGLASAEDVRSLVSQIMQLAEAGQGMAAGPAPGARLN